MPELGWITNVFSALGGAAALWTFQRNFRFVVPDYNLKVSYTEDNADFHVSFDLFNRAKEATTILDANLLCLRTIADRRLPEVTILRRLYLEGKAVERRNGVHPELKPGSTIRLDLMECLSISKSEPPSESSLYNYIYQLCIVHSQRRKPQIFGQGALTREISGFARHFTGQV